MSSLLAVDDFERVQRETNLDKPPLCFVYADCGVAHPPARAGWTEDGWTEYRFDFARDGALGAVELASAKNVDVLVRRELSVHYHAGQTFYVRFRFDALGRWSFQTELAKTPDV